MRSITLNSHQEMPAIGLGLWLMRDEQECINAVKTALKLGYRHFDTAQIYDNEGFLGRALEQSSVARSELFVTTKIWNENMYWDDVLESFEESLAKLKMDYVYLLLLHFPVTELRRPAWRQMERLHREGKAKSIGVSNYTIRHLQELLRECEVPPAVNQVELHVYLQQPELVKFCQDHGIVVEAYSPLAHGEGLDNPVLAEVAVKHDKTPAQVMIRWCLKAGAVPLPKSTHEQRIRANFEALDFELDADDMKKLKGLDQDLRTCWDPTHVA